MSTYQCDSSTAQPNTCGFCSATIPEKNSFCNRSCSARFNNAKRIIDVTKTKDFSCISCGCLVVASNRCSSLFVKCNDCKAKKKITRTATTELGQILEKSQAYTRKSQNLTKLGFDFAKNIDDEALKLKRLLEDEYINSNESMLTLKKKYNIPSLKTIYDLFNTLQIQARTLSTSNRVAFETGRSVLPDSNVGKQTRHTTWYGASVFLRSTHELELATILDKAKIKYLVEGARIPYFDRNRNQQRIAIPDFILPDSKTIIEVKSNFWYDQENMMNKRKAYHINGYDFMLYLDHKLYR